MARPMQCQGEEQLRKAARTNNMTSLISKLLVVGVAACLLSLNVAEAARKDQDPGEKLFRKCRACHTLEVGGKHKLGPNLGGMFGRTAGTVAGYTKFSKAMRNSGIVWTEKALDSFLSSPSKFIPRNAMSFTGMRKPEKRHALIEYIEKMTE